MLPVQLFTALILIPLPNLYAAGRAPAIVTRSAWPRRSAPCQVGRWLSGDVGSRAALLGLRTERARDAKIDATLRELVSGAVLN